VKFFSLSLNNFTLNAARRSPHSAGVRAQAAAATSADGAIGAGPATVNDDERAVDRDMRNQLHTHAEIRRRGRPLGRPTQPG